MLAICAYKYINKIKLKLNYERDFIVSLISFIYLKNI